MSTPFVAKSWQNSPATTTPISAAALVDLETRLSNFSRLNATAVGGTHTAVDGELSICSGGSYTVTLPAPAANAMVGVLATAPASGPVTITTPSGAIIGRSLGPSAASAALTGPGDFVVVLSDGTNYYVVAGQTGATANDNASLQNGVINSTDLVVSAIAINTGTGALTFTIAGASPAKVTASGGALVSIYPGSQTVTPSPLVPTSATYAVVGVEIDITGSLSIVKGANVGTQLNTGTLIAQNTPATSSGKLRLVDFAIWNNAGVYNFSDHTTVATQGVNWIDRRPWARGGLAHILRTANASAGSDYTTASASQVPIDATNLSIRMECTGAPLRIQLLATARQSAGGDQVLVSCNLDGASIDGFTTGLTFNTFTSANFDTVSSYNYLTVPTAGSHLLVPTYMTGGAGSAILRAETTVPLVFVVEELNRQHTSNGHA